MDSATSGKNLLSDIPRGCTHVQLANPLDYCQRPTFMKWDFDFRGPESGNVYNCWYIWHRFKHYSDWVKDYGYQRPRDKSLFLTVDQFKTVYIS